MIKTKLLEELINDIPFEIPENPEIYDIVLDSGATNGGYLIGCLLYLKELEEKKYIKIRKISGSSIGSICGFLYICNNLDLYEDIYCTSREDIILNINFKKCTSILKNFINKQDYLFYKKFNNNLYITYYDTSRKSDVLTYLYKSNKDLFNKIKYSSYLPIFIDGNLTSDKKIDATIPHIFYESNKVLFINLTTYKKLSNCLNVSNKNSSYKILNGIIDIHEFYTTKVKTELCSFVNDWTFSENALFQLRIFIAYIIKYFISLLFELNEHYQNHNEEYKAQFLKYIVKIVRNHILLASA